MGQRKWTSIILILLMLILLTACGGGGGAAKFEDGKLALEEAKLDFGNNEVTAEAVQMELIKTKEEEAPEGLQSDLYEVTIDLDLEESVTFSLPYKEDEEVEDENAQLVLGIGREYEYDDGRKDTVYSYLPGEHKDGQFTATFIPAEALEELKFNGAVGGGKASGRKLSLGIFRSSMWFKEGGHFELSFPHTSANFRTFLECGEQLLHDLEDIYQEYLGKGYNYNERSSWPMEVSVQKISALGYYSYGWKSANGKIILNLDLFKDGYQRDRVISLLAHEFFHFVQGNYATTFNSCTWLDEATATYFEGEKLGNTPAIFQEHREKIFRGIIPENDSAEEGYARQPVIKYLAKKNGEDFIRKAYESGKAGSSWEAAFKTSAGDLAMWAPDFYDALVRGEVGTYVPHTIHRELTSTGSPIGQTLALTIPDKETLAVMVESDEIPSLGESTLEVDGFGAQLLALTIEQDQVENLADGIDPIVTVDPYASVKVYDILGRNVQVLPQEADQVVINNFKEGLEQEHLYLVLLAGVHSSGKTPYTVRVDLQPYPSLDEVVGIYKDGALFISEVEISPELEAEAQEESTEDSGSGEVFGVDVGCDLDMINLLKGLEGQTMPRILDIKKTAEAAGTLLLIEDLADPDDRPMAFSFSNGVLNFDTADGEVAEITGEIVASYGKNKEIQLSGTLKMTFSGDENTWILMNVTGSKPLATP